MKKYLLFLLGLLLAVGLEFFQTSIQTNQMNAQEAKLDSQVPINVEVEPPEWTKDATLYEVNVRQYSQQGTFTAVEEDLPRLKELGVDILWFMPIHPIGKKHRKGELGSYYSVVDYKAVNPHFGTLEDFKSLVDRAHSLGMHVMMDWVGNHTAWDAVWAQQHPDWYEQDENGNFVLPRQDWTDVISLDYSNPQMRAAMLDAMTYWVKEVGIDGYRCDVAGGVPVDFWETARAQLERIKPVFMLAEDEDTPQLLEKAFDMNYSWKLYKLMNQLAQGKAKVQDLRDYFAWEQSIYPQAAYRMRFLTNHDENSWNGTIEERLGNTFKTFAVFMYTIPGMPLIYNGQEVGLDKRLAFFEKDPIVWKDNNLPAFYRQLNGLKANHPALGNGDFGGNFRILPTTDQNAVFAFQREKGDNKLVAAFNFSNQQSKVQFSQISDGYREYFRQEKRSLAPDDTIALEPWGYRVWIRQ